MKYSLFLGTLVTALAVFQQKSPAQVETQSFASEETAQTAGWIFNDEGQNPARECDGCETDLSWKPTNFAGGAEAGEGGGLAHRSGGIPVGFYGDLSIGQLSLDDALMASGKITLVNTNFDGHFQFGFFDGTRLREDPLDYGALLGFLIAEPGGGVDPNFRWGAHAVSDDLQQSGGHNDFDAGWPDSEPLDFSIEYDPDAGPAGLLTVTIGDEPPAELELTDAQRAAGGTFTAFGLSTGPFTGSARPDVLEAFIDDVSYTSLAVDITPGDFNGDDVVDASDFAILAENFDTGTSFENGDINFDGRVDLRDFAQFRAIFNSQAPGAAAVPEPNGFVLVVSSVLLVSLVRRRTMRE